MRSRRRGARLLRRKPTTALSFRWTRTSALRARTRALRTALAEPTEPTEPTAPHRQGAPRSHTACGFRRKATTRRLSATSATAPKAATSSTTRTSRRKQTGGSGATSDRTCCFPQKSPCSTSTRRSTKRTPTATTCPTLLGATVRSRWRRCSPLRSRTATTRA